MKYLAYGVDMSSEWAALNVPAARAVGTVMLIGWRLEFWTWHGDVVPALARRKESRTPCVLWEVPDDRAHYLDIAHGFSYRRETVELPSGVEAAVYLLNGGDVQPPAQPLVDFMRGCYADYGINVRYLDEAIRRAEKAVAARKVPTG